jgi:hypothetical protein
VRASQAAEKVVYSVIPRFAWNDRMLSFSAACSANHRTPIMPTKCGRGKLLPIDQENHRLPMKFIYSPLLRHF